MWHELIAARSIACCCALLSGSCAAAGAGGTTATPNPASAGWLTPSGTWISEVSGKMNVPKPSAKFYTGHPLFLWPGLFISPGPHEGYPDRKAMGLFQPVLTLGQGCSSSIGCGPDQPWTIANWYSNCTGSKPDAADYCHDAYQSVQAGDTLSWYMRRVVSSTAFPMQYEMGWSSALNTSQSSRPFVQTISAGPVFIWAIEAEPWFAINNATVDPSYDMLPQSPYRVWDVVVKDQVRRYFLVFVPTIREIRDFYREMERTNRESITMYSMAQSWTRSGSAGLARRPQSRWIASGRDRLVRLAFRWSLARHIRTVRRRARPLRKSVR
eukprot:SAG31_NODE_2722_length_5188_cov_6.223030_7_plen_326_part_00